MRLKAYLEESAHPFYGAVAALGMLILYEICLVWNPDSQVIYRNAPEAWMRQILHFFGLSHHYVSFFWITLGLIAIPLLYHKDSNPKVKTFGWLVLEAIIWGSLSGLVIQGLMQNLLFAQTQLTGSLVSDLALAVGAGLFEELFFRVGLTSLLIYGFGQIFKIRLFALLLAITVASFLFSLAHYTGNAGDAFDLYSFTFRFVAGFWFTALYATRGFAITALAHAFYDIFIII